MTLSACWLVQVGADAVQQEDDGILNFKSGLVGKLEQIQKCTDYDSELVFHDV